MNDIDKQLHNLSSKLWVTRNYEYHIKVDNLRAKIRHREEAITKLKAKIKQYTKDLELAKNELDKISRRKKITDKTDWSSRCKSGHHCSAIDGCKGKNNTCKCSCHEVIPC